MASTGKTDRELQGNAHDTTTGERAAERSQAQSQGRPCPMCRKPTPPREQNRAHPFCSPRCQLADLGRWLDEDYRL